MGGATPVPVRTERTEAILAPSRNMPSSGLGQASQRHDESVSIDFAAQNYTIIEGQAANVTVRLSKTTAPLADGHLEHHAGEQRERRGL